MIKEILKIKNGKKTLEIKKGTKVFLVENAKSKKDLNAEIEIKVSKGAELNYVSVNDLAKGTLKRSIILEENAKADLNFLVIGCGEDNIKNVIEVKHNGVGSESNMFVGLLADGNSVLDVNGLVEINKNAQNAIGEQKMEGLILSPKAKILAKPDLKVGNENVKCSHGVSITRFNEEKLFYLMNKGLNEKQAKEFLTQALVFKVLDKLKDEKLKNKIFSKFKEKFKLN